MSVLRFSPLQSQPTSSFWTALTSLKLDRLKLDDSLQEIQGWIRPGSYARPRDGETNAIWIGGLVMLDASSLNTLVSEKQPTPAGHLPVRGVMKNFNTIEEFKDAQTKKELLKDLARETDQASTSSRMSPFLLVTFADLKKYVFHYWFAFPTTVQKPAWESDEWRATEFEPQAGDDLAYLYRNGQTASLSEWSTFFQGVPQEQACVVVRDTATTPDTAGWPLRNVLRYLSRNHGVRKLQVILYRPGMLANGEHGSRQFTVWLPDEPAGDESIVGWERNLKGALTSRVADLGSTMDPRRLADQAVDLNLKLMRWRIMPDLDLDKIKDTKCLLLGAGTLGCYVARTLMGWGVRNITLVDSGKVSYSNPVRQPLFTLEDCVNGGRPKAECAAARLQEIFPGVIARGIQMMIPMPGHPISDSDIEATRSTVRELKQLISSHDAVFLLMDSRESRWLPTMIGASLNKIVINAALGFDSWLVMRHGAKDGEDRLGCYFCSDVVAPADSLTDRTLDQMCTVTRPGIAPIAAASAVELLVSLLQHPKGIHAPADRATAQPTSTLGLLPHQLRGFLGQWRTMLIDGPAFDRCTACSRVVLDTYAVEGFSLLQRAFNESGYLERLTGLDKLHEEGEAAMEAMDWDDEDDEDA